MSKKKVKSLKLDNYFRKIIITHRYGIKRMQNLQLTALTK